MLEVNHFTVQYGNREPAIKEFSMKLGKGEIISIVGESGSGKTTLIRSILGVLPTGGKITKGDIIFEGKSLLKNTKEEWRTLRGNDISMIFQDSGSMLNPIRKIGSQFVEYIKAHEKISKKEAYEKAVKMLKKMRLPDGARVMEQYPFQLSGGQRQRIGIAMALIFEPKLLLADEPTSSLDVTTQAQIVREMMELRKEYGTAIILVTHNIGVAAYMGENMIVMQNGEIVEQGNRMDILKNPTQNYTKELLDAVPEMEGERFV